MQTVILLVVIGIISGALSGLVGIGGGIVIVPALVFFLGYSQKLAQGTSLGILLLPVGILAVLQFYQAGYVKIPTVLLVSAGFIVGSYFGSRIALSIPQATVKKLFAVLILIVALKLLFFDKTPVSTKTESAVPGSQQQ